MAEVGWRLPRRFEGVVLMLFDRVFLCGVRTSNSLAWI